MVKLEEILSMAYLEKTSYTGSTEGMRYRLEKEKQKIQKEDGEEAEIKVLRCTIWPEPFNFHTTPEDKKESRIFSFDRDGVTDAVAWMNDQLFANRDLYEVAARSWDQYHLPE